MLQYKSKKTLHLPSGNIFGIFTVTAAITIANFEYCTNGATIFTGNTFQADVVFTAIFGVSMSGEGTGISQFTGSRAGETIGNFYKIRNKTYVLDFSQKR